MKARVLTALVGIPLVLAVVGCTNPWPLYLLILAAAVICQIEALPLINSRYGWKEHVSWALFAAFWMLSLSLRFFVELSNARLARGSLISEQAYVGGSVTLFIIGLVSAYAGAALARYRNAASFGVFWHAVPLAMLGMLHPAGGYATVGFELPAPLLMLLFPVWAGDIAAMLGGMAFGKHPLAPKISPKKTWEGAISNFAASLLVGWAVGAWLQYEPWVGLACGAAVGIFGQLGDLFESALKRAAGKKDSGTLLPGHGGVLDRIDALLGAVIPVWLILYFSGSL